MPGYLVAFARLQYELMRMQNQEVHVYMLFLLALFSASFSPVSQINIILPNSSVSLEINYV